MTLTLHLMVVVLLSAVSRVVLADDIFTDANRYKGFTDDQPKIFYVRNNLKGNVEFRESENVTIEVFISGHKEDREKFHVKYNILDNNTVVDIQVWLKAEQQKWTLIGGLVGGAASLLLLAIIIISIFIKRCKHNKSQGEMEFEMEKLDRGKNVREKLQMFMSSKRRRTGSSTKEKQYERTTTSITHGDVQVKDRAKALEKPEDASADSRESTQADSKVCNRRSNQAGPTKAAPILMMSLFTVVMAVTSTVPQARIVIHTPSKLVKPVSKIFFNEKYHGRLIVSHDWHGDVKGFQQFAVPQAFSAVPSLDPCFLQCKYGCDVKTKTCICYRGYKMVDNQCTDINECLTGENICYDKLTCRNNNGSYQCTCPDKMWGNGKDCKACSRDPCTKGFYESAQCTRTRDRVCTACSAKCTKSTYQQYGCGLTFDRKCIDISKPLVAAKRGNITEIVKTRVGSRVLVPNSASILVENRFRVRSTNTTINVEDGSSYNFTLHRNSGFVLDVEVFHTHLSPKYVDYDGRRGSNNPAISSLTGFNNIRSQFCRFPAQDYYELTHRLRRERQTMVKSVSCRQADIDSYRCPKGIDAGERYYYRAINEACKKAKSNIVCKTAVNCNLPQPDNTLYCTHYVSILSALFAMEKHDFEDKSLYEFDSVQCQNAFISCDKCRTQNCSKCAASCSCCYKDCLTSCEPYYSFGCASRLKPKRCAIGDVSEFELKPKYSSDLKLRFNCYLQHAPPSSLYTIKYRVRHQHGTPFTSHWIAKTKPTSSEQTNTLDSLEISHSDNNAHKYYMKAERNTLSENFKYRVAEMGTKRIVRGGGAKKIQPLEPFLFNIGDKSWKNIATCHKLEDWQSMITNDFTKFTSPQVRHIGPTKTGDFAYEISASPPTMQVQISKHKSILKYVFNDSIIVNDGSFHTRIERANSSWIIQIKGKLKHCPSVIGLVIIDESDHVKIIESDLLILCPDKKFNMKGEIPRRGVKDRERLFTVYLTDSTQEYKLQVAVVDNTKRTSSQTFQEKHKDTRREPWIILTPLFVTTGCTLLALIVLMIYAQKTTKQPPKMEVASASGWVWVKDGNNKDKNRLKRRHLILVVFVVVARVVYSFIFTFSMAFAIMTLLHADNIKIISDYRAFVQRKVDETKVIAVRMDQFRENEIKSSVDQAEDVQKACDYHLGLQMKWLQYNMSCTLQTNHMKMFNKISQKIIDKLTAQVQALEKKVKNKVGLFSENTRHKLSSLKDEVENYGRRVYDNKWFGLPREAYKISRGRKKRAIGQETPDNASHQETPDNANHQETPDNASHQVTLDNASHQETPDSARIASALKVLSRVRRSFSGNHFLGFLDFVGALDQNRLVDLENSINNKIESFTASFNDFKQVMTSTTPPFLPVSAAMLCPIRHMAKTVKSALEKGLKLGLKGVCDKTDVGDIQKQDAHCISINVSSFCSSQDDDDIFNKNKKLDSSSQRVYFEKATGMDSEHNVSAAEKSSVIQAAEESSHYNVEKGDAFEEQIDSQKEDKLKRQKKLKELGSIYDAQVFITVRTTAIYVFAIIDILLFVYRCLKTYQIAMKLLYGFEQVVEHDQYESHEPDTKEKLENTMRRMLDIVTKCFTKFIQGIKNLQKKLVSTNIVPMLIVVGVGAVTFYLIVVITFNVMNVTVIEELGGYRMVSARLDADLDFTNGAIADHVTFLNDHDMKIYKESVGKTLTDYKAVLQDFKTAQKERFEDFNGRFCSITNKSTCDPLVPDFPKVSFSACIVPRFSSKTFDEYNGEEYRYKLKYESKKYVDAVRNIFLDTLYFIIGVILALILVTVCTVIVFFFMKSRDMIRVQYTHIYPTLPPELLKEYGIDNDDVDELSQKTDSQESINKVKIPEKFKQNKDSNC